MFDFREEKKRKRGRSKRMQTVMTTQSPSTRETRTRGRRRAHTEIVVRILGVKAPTRETKKAREKKNERNMKIHSTKHELT